MDGASQAEAHLKELNQPQHVQVDKDIVAEQSRFYNGPMDVDAAAIELAKQINQTYWDDSGTSSISRQNSEQRCNNAMLAKRRTVLALLAEYIF